MSQWTSNVSELINDEIMSDMLKESLETELMASGIVNWHPDMPGSTTKNLPSVGKPVVGDRTEGQAKKFNPLDLGEFTFTISEFREVGNEVSQEALEDMHYRNAFLSLPLRISRRPKDKQAGNLSEFVHAL